MTVTTELARAELDWTGVESAFPAGFPADKAADVAVFFRTPAGVITTLAAGVNYSVNLATGSKIVTVVPLTMPAAPGKVVIRRRTPALVSEVLQDGEGFSLAIIQQLHDRAAMRSGEDRDTFSRAIVLQEGAALGEGDFDLGGSGLANVAPGTSSSHAATVSQIQDLLAAAGNVPTPVIGDTNRFLVATGAETYAWLVMALAMMPDGFLSADAAGRGKMADKFVTNAKMADVPAVSIKGRRSGTSGPLQDLTPLEAAMAAGAVIQTAFAVNTAYGSTVSTLPLDNSAPQRTTEVTDLATLAFTPKSATSILRIKGSVAFYLNSVGTAAACLFLDGVASAVAVKAVTVPSGYYGHIDVEYFVVAGSTDVRTYVLGASGNVTVNINGNASGKIFGTSLYSELSITEIGG